MCVGVVCRMEGVGVKIFIIGVSGYVGCVVVLVFDGYEIVVVLWSG